MSAADIVHALLVVFGVGLVIFVHELGHFLAARWAGARVEVFSIGMGPRLFGWRRGDTLFQVAALPLGGYVKLAGEYEEGRPPRPGELGAMSVFHRFVYYSGGVVMNVLFALVAMPLVLLAGLPGVEPVLGEAQKGSPAWHARLPENARVESVNGHDPFDFMGLAMEIAVSGKRETELVLRTAEGERVTARIQPEYDPENGTYKLGVTSAPEPDGELVVVPGGPAEAAGVRPEERLVAVLGQPAEMPRVTALRRALATGEPLRIAVAAPGGEPREVLIAPREVEPDRRRLVFGIEPVQNAVFATRAPAPAAGSGLGPELGPELRAETPTLALAAGDRLLTVGGQPFRRAEQLRDGLLAAVGGTFELEFERDGERKSLSLTIPDVATALAIDSDVALETDTGTSRVLVQAGSAAARAGLADGDRIVSVDGNATTTWDEVFTLVRAAAKKARPVTFEVWRDTLGADGANVQQTLALTVTARAATTLDYGLGLATRTAVQRAKSVPEALRIGALKSWRLLVNTWRSLQKMLFTDEVSTKNLGGIITISVLSFQSASQGLPHLFFILAFISLNLAILNLLPIPILDGGHLMFLLIEWIKGAPVSERTFGYSQRIGLVLILSLMIYVTYQDVVRWVFPD